jgi:hypothetical protein
MHIRIKLQAGGVAQVVKSWVQTPAPQKKKIELQNYRASKWKNWDSNPG